MTFLTLSQNTFALNVKCNLRGDQFLWFQSKQCLSVVLPGLSEDGNNICRNVLLSPAMGPVIADLSLADAMSPKPLIGQSGHMRMRWHLWCWHEVCEVCITQIYKLRKQDTPDPEIRGQNWQLWTLPQSSWWDISLSFARGVIVDWSIVEIDNWFTLFAWLGLVSVLIKITIRNSVLIISYCENIITGTLIWIITGLDSWDSDSVASSVSVSQLWRRHSARPGVSLMFQIGMKLHHPQFPLNGRMRGGGQENKNYHTNETWNAKLWPALALHTSQMGAVSPTVLINSSHLTLVYEDSL